MKDEMSVFVEYFGGLLYIKVLDFLIQGQDFDYGMTEVARGAEVGWSAFSSVWLKLIEKEIVVMTRMVGNAKMFRLNKDNVFVDKLLKLDLELAELGDDKLLVCG